MARKHAGDFLNILSNPEHGGGIVKGKTPVSFQHVQPTTGSAFPGIGGLGAVTGTGVPPMKARAPSLLDDDSAKPRGLRMDLALAALLGVLVTNIVSFTLGARAGRQSVEPTTTEVTASAAKAVEILQQAEPVIAAPATTTTVDNVPPSAPAGVTTTGPQIPGSMSSVAPATGTPAQPLVRVRPEPAPEQAAPAAAVQDMAGRYVVRLISLKYDDRGKKTAEKIRHFVEAQGYAPGHVRTSRGWLVVEAGAWKSYDEAKRAQSRIRKLKVGFNNFDTAFVVQRTR